MEGYSGEDAVPDFQLFHAVGSDDYRRVFLHDLEEESSHLTPVREDSSIPDLAVN